MVLVLVRAWAPAWVDPWVVEEVEAWVQESVAAELARALVAEVRASAAGGRGLVAEVRQSAAEAPELVGEVRERASVLRLAVGIAVAEPVPGSMCPWGSGWARLTCWRLKHLVIAPRERAAAGEVAGGPQALL
jgi:hypothetical protein